ncbi:Nrap protein [Violaceomyces palustris]|uniref:Nrap protein n=1 Tax=Violaceomyces palustris TaxID=1673888 RepID=A0ACD0P1Q2_9BASI|nr:Nrap protein [Violaceomyces palustris]
MPGVKRKANAVSSSQSSVQPSSSKKKQALKNSPSKAAQVSEDDDEFDDDEDLLASAVAGTGSAALADDDDNGDDDEEDEDEDEEIPTESKKRIVEILSDEDMDGGFEDLEADDLMDDQDDSEHGQDDRSTAEASKKSKAAALYSLPTTEEVQGLKETGELFKSNVFKLKIDEMLPEVRPAFDKAGALELVLRRLQTLFDTLKPLAPRSIPDAINAFDQKVKGSIKIPFPDPAPKDDAQYKLAFQKPSAMHLIGSWPLKSAAKRPEGLDVDVAVVMPSSLFQEKDHMNFRYFHKRAFYLAVLADAITNSKQPKLGVQTSFQLMEGDPRRPILVLKPLHDKSDTDFTKTKALIRIHLAHEPNLFPYGRLAPSRNSVRVGAGESDARDLTPTPRYNSAILADGLQVAHLVYLHATAQACPAFADACLLLKTWAFQRGFGSGSRISKTSGAPRRQVAGSHSIRFVLTMVLAHLLHGEEKVAGKGATRPKLANGFSSYQLFRGVVDWLASHDFTTKPVFMKDLPSAGLVSRSDKIPREDFSSHFEKVMVDPSGSINLLASLPAGSVELLQHEAKKALAMLNDSNGDHFEALFLQDRTASAFTFDETALLKIPPAKVGDNLAAIRKADFGSTFFYALDAISRTAIRALRGRSKLTSMTISASSPIFACWSLESARPGNEDEAELGIMLDPEQAWKIVEHGPPSDDKESAEEFRNFWGNLAELRRFKDGRILESVIWNAPTIPSRFSIPRRILSYAFERHHSMGGAASVSFLADKFEGLLSVPEALKEKTYLADPEEKGFQLVQQSYDYLTKELRGLDNLPLSLINIVPSSPGLRATSEFIPAPLSLEGLGTRVPDVASYLPAQDIVLTLESSGKWPDDLPAIQAMKAAFYERIATGLMSKIDGCKSNVAYDRDADENELRDKCSLEIILPTGFAFRARIHHEREQVLLERILADKYESGSKKRKARSALAKYERQFVFGPRHHASIAALGHKMPALGDSIRLVKRWVSSQMLSTHVPEELIELICASAFLSPEEGAPASSVAGFARVLRLLAIWRWKEDPLYAAIETAISAAEGVHTFLFPSEKKIEVENHFSKTRSTDPGISNRAWFIVTEEDTEGKRWGKERPFTGAADGVKRLAKGACSILERGASLSEVEGKGLFVPSLDHYDFVIELDPKVLTRYAQSVSYQEGEWNPSFNAKQPKFKNMLANEVVPSVLGPLPRVDFDPAQGLVQLLTDLYSDSFRLFHDRSGGKVIGGLWNPSLERVRDFRVALGFNSKVCEAEGEEKAKGKGKGVKINCESIVGEIERLGQGIVTKVKLVRGVVEVGSSN